jgi:hypothetical protein
MLSAARLQRGLFGTGITRLAETALAEQLAFRRRALAFHLGQPRAEDEWNHPDDEHFPEDLADSIHHIHPGETAKRFTLFDANIADRFHLIHDFCQDDLETLRISTATSWGHESTIPRSPNLLKASRVPSNRSPHTPEFRRSLAATVSSTNASSQGRR